VTEAHTPALQPEDASPSAETTTPSEASADATTPSEASADARTQAPAVALPDWPAFRRSQVWQASVAASTSAASDADAPPAAREPLAPPATTAAPPVAPTGARDLSDHIAMPSPAQPSAPTPAAPVTPSMSERAAAEVAPPVPGPAQQPAPTATPMAPPPAAPSTPAATTPPNPSIELRRSLGALRTEVGKAVVGQDAAVTGLVIALLCRGHVLLEGVPGVAKTLLVRTLAAALDLGTKRIQFTPDLMPGDVTGSLVYDARTAQFSFREGPVFTNLLLADEINRTPPKTQASLLEAMEERQVSVDGKARPLPDPFIVIATQNPVEYEGTYPLPEAQLDRFLLKLTLPIPQRDHEIEVLARHAAGFDPRDLAAAGVRPVAGARDLARARAEVGQVQIARDVLGYAVDVCRATRTSPSLSLGVSPRGATALLATSRAWAWLSGRAFVTPDDIKALAHPTLRHRVQLRAEAELEGVTAESVLDTVLSTVPVPR
jgi:MoxR-like ATPase